MEYFLAHNSENVFHYCEIKEGQMVTTGQPYLEYFNTLEQLKQRLNELGVEYTESNFDEMVVEDGFDEPLLDDEI
jgi:hypothetical protein